MGREMHNDYTSHPYRNSVHMASCTSAIATEWYTIPLSPSTSSKFNPRSFNVPPMSIPTEAIRTATSTASGAAHALKLIRHKLSLPFKKKSSSRPITPPVPVSDPPRDSSFDSVIDIRCDNTESMTLSSATSQTNDRPITELPPQWKDQIFDLVAEALVARPEPAHPHSHNRGHSSSSVSHTSRRPSQRPVPSTHPYRRNSHYRSPFPESDVIDSQENFLDLSSPPSLSTVILPPIAPPAPTRQRARSSSMRARGPLLPLSIHQALPAIPPVPHVAAMSTSDSLGLGLSNLTSPPLATSTTSSPILPYHDPQSPISLAPALPEGRGFVRNPDVDPTTRAKAALSLDLSVAFEDGISLVELEGMLDELHDLSEEMRAARARKVARAIMTGQVAASESDVATTARHDATFESRHAIELLGKQAKATKSGRKPGKRVTSGKENAPVGSKIPVRRSIWSSIRSPKLKASEEAPVTAALSPDWVPVSSPLVLSPPVCRIVVTPPAEEGLHEWELDMSGASTLGL